MSRSGEGYKREIFEFQYVAVHEFVRHLAYYRVARESADHTSPFWFHTTDAHAKMAVLEWCKVFGACGPNNIHWQKLSEEDSERLKQSFRTVLFARTQLSPPDWKSYHQNMCAFRDCYVAHTDAEKDTPTFPSLDKALEIAFIYDEWIRALISPDTIEEELLQNKYESFRQEALSIVISC